MGTVRTEEKSLNITRLLVRKTNTRSFGKVTSRAITRKWLFYVGKYDVCCIKHLHPQWVLDMYSNTSRWPLMYSCLWLGHLMSRKESKGNSKKLDSAIWHVLCHFFLLFHATVLHKIKNLCTTESTHWDVGATETSALDGLFKPPSNSTD